MKIFNHKITAIYYFIAVVIPMYSPVKNLLSGSLPYWHDAAWGLLIGLENLEKIRLIGYEGGIPGVFYGPHWFWLVSLVQIFSKNPAVIAAFTLFIPYFGIVPYLLWKNRKLFGENATILLWLIFILALRANVLNLWQIYLTPVVFLAATLTLIKLNTGQNTFSEFLKVIFVGICSSLLINLNGVFGWVIFLVLFLYLLSFHFIQIRKIDRDSTIYCLRIILFFLSGFLISHLPIIIFEARHNFIQTRAIIYVLKQSFVYNSAIVGRLGLTDIQIIKEFFSIPLILLGLPINYFAVFWVFAGLILFVFCAKYILKLTLEQKRLFVFLIFSSASLLAAFSVSKNPIWAYHFIGAEIIFLLMIGLLTTRMRILFLLLGIWIIWVFSLATFKNFVVEGVNPLKIDTLAAKKYVVDTIYADAAGKPFGVFAYSPSLYTFDYDYLFKWLGSDKYGYMPNLNSDLVYLIIPVTDQAIKDDFINYRTPRTKYFTDREWVFPNNVSLVRRIPRITSKL